MSGELAPETVGLLLIALIGALLLHMLGIYCCCKDKGQLQGQKIVLVNLSSVEIVTITFFITHLCVHYADYTPDQPTEDGGEIFCSVYHVVTSLCYSSMLLLPVDRILCIISPVSYFIRTRDQILKVSVVMAWLSSIAWACLFGVAPISEDMHNKVIIYSTYAAQAVFLFVTFISYAIVGVFFLPRQEYEVRKTYRVSVALITAFTFFIMIPNFIEASKGTRNTFRILITYIGHSVDPLLYIFLDKSLRPVAISLITCNRYENRKGDNKMTVIQMNESFELLTNEEKNETVLLAVEYTGVVAASTKIIKESKV